MLATLGVGVGAGVAAYEWRAAVAPAADRAPGALAPDAGALAAAADAASLPAPDAGGDESKRTIIVSEGGYSFQALVPERLVAGVDSVIELTTWDPAGEPVAVEEIVVTVEEPGGVERGFAARRTKTPGRYRFSHSFRVQGTHYLHVFPPSGNTSVKLWLDVVASRRDN